MSDSPAPIALAPRHTGGLMFTGEVTIGWIRVLCLAGGLSAVVVEFLQGQQEWFSLAHETGEVVRNLGYALATAYAFYFFLEEKPAADLRRTAYSRNQDVLLSLVGAGRRLLESLLANQGEELDGDVVDRDRAWQVVGQLDGTNERWPVTLSPFNSLYRSCEQIEKRVRSLAHDEQSMDDEVRQALRALRGLREGFEDDIAVKSVRLAEGQEPLLKMPRTLQGCESMFFSVVDACEALADALVEHAGRDLAPDFRRARSQPLISAGTVGMLQIGRQL